MKLEGVCVGSGVLEEVGGEYDHFVVHSVGFLKNTFKKNKVCGGCCRLYVNIVSFCIKDKNTWVLVCMSSPGKHS